MNNNNVTHPTNKEPAERRAQGDIMNKIKIDSLKKDYPDFDFIEIPEPEFVPIPLPETIPAYCDENAGDASAENDPMTQPPYYATWSHERLVDELLRSYKGYNELHAKARADAKLFVTTLDLAAQVTSSLFAQLKEANDRLANLTGTDAIRFVK
jgi:hypothetical protein